jgi:transcriptional regulator with XRE-family HTH domain
MVPPKNIVGPQLRKLRYQRGLTQDMFAAQCSVRGFEMSRVTLSKIEAQVRCVVDSELLAFAQILGVDIRELFPKDEGRPR